MVKGHNEDNQKKPNQQKGAQTISAKQQRSSGDKGRNADENQAVKRSGDKKGKNAI